MEFASGVVTCKLGALCFYSSLCRLTALCSEIRFFTTHYAYITLLTEKHSSELQNQTKF